MSAWCRSTGFLVLCLAGVASAAGQKGPIPVRIGEQFGFETRAGRTAIRPHFDQVTPFRDGRAVVQRGGKWGFIDTDGRWVGPPRYDWIDPGRFDEGPALVSAEGLYGYLDRNGVEVMPLSLEQATPFVGGFACIYEPQAFAFGLIDAEANPVSGYRYDACDPRFSSDRARVSKDDRWGYVDTEGELVLPLRYDRAEPFSEGLALVEEAGLRFFIDPAGTRRIPANAEAAGSFHEGRAWIRYEVDKVGFIDRNGRVVVQPVWRAVRDFDQGVAWVQDPVTARWGLVGKDGSTVLEPTYEEVGPFVDGLARVAAGRKYGFVDTGGHLVIPLAYASAGDFSEGFVAVSVERGGPMGYLDRKGEPLGEAVYDEAGPFQGRVAPVTRCAWEKQGILKTRQVRVCEAFFVDDQGRERR